MRIAGGKRLSFTYDELKTLYIIATTFCLSLTYPFPQGQCLTMSVPCVCSTYQC